jgi:hypothetical protein
LLLAVCKHHMGDYEGAREIYKYVYERAQLSLIINEPTSKYITEYIYNIVNGGDFVRNTNKDDNIDDTVRYLFSFKPEGALIDAGDDLR